MFLPRNGSFISNAILVAVGAIAGSGITVLLTQDSGRNSGSSGLGWSDKTGASGRSLALSPASDAAASTRDKSASPETTIASAMRIEGFQDRAAALRAAGAEAAAKDIGAALALAETFKSEADKLEFLRGIYAVWGRTDPLAALEHSKNSFTAGLQRSETIGIAMNKWGTQDPRAAWQWADQNLSGPLKDEAMTDLVIGWTRRSPTDAANWLSAAGYFSQPLFNAVARTWAERDPSAAANWAASIPNSTMRRTAVVSVAGEAAKQDPEKVFETYSPTISGPQSDPDVATDLAITLADICGTIDPAATAKAIMKLAPGPARDEAANVLATVWAASDIKGAIAWTAQLADANMRRQVITHIGTTWGAIEPDSALNWLYSLPAADASEGIIGAYNSWAATEPATLREWIDSKPASGQMDQARLSLADILAPTDIRSSMDLAFGITNGTSRDDAVGRYFHEWRKIDNDTAQDWLKSVWGNLGPSTQQRLTKEQARRVVAR